MSIRPSSIPDITRLLDDLSSPQTLTRESAAARLAIIGAPALPRLLDLIHTPSVPMPARVAAVRVLSPAGGPAVLTAATRLLASLEDELAIEAVDLCRAFLEGGEPHATTAFEQLTALALDGTASVERRLAALGALEAQPDDLMRPVYDALARDSARRIVTRVMRKHAGVNARLDELVESGFPDDPALVSAIVHEDTEHPQLSTFRKAIERVRECERGVSPERAQAWRLIRAQLHHALGQRGSRLALYDLKDTLSEARGPLALGFLAAAAAVGDVECLIPIARAWVEADGDRRVRDQLATAFSAIVAREGLTRRHPTLRRVLELWPSAGVLVAAAPKTKPRRVTS